MKLSVPRIGYKDKIAQIRRTIIWNEYGSITIYFFSTCFAGQLANSHHLWYCRDIRCRTSAGVYQWRYNSCLFRWFGAWLLSGNKSDLDGNGLFGVEWASKTQDVREDSAIAGVWALGMALGVIFIFLTPGYSPNLSAYLFGNILTISLSDIIWIAALAVVLIAVFSLYLREIVYVAFDSDFAKTQHIHVKWIEYMMMFFIALTIVLSIRLVGIMLLMSLLTLPQITVNLFTSDFKKIIWGSIVFGFLSCVVGLVLSYFLNVPSGAFIILVLVLVFLILKGVLFFTKRQ